MKMNASTVLTKCVDQNGLYSRDCSTAHHYPEYYYQPQNTSKTTPGGIAAYRSALTLDWMSAEDMRQRELASAFEQETHILAPVSHSDCISYNRPSAGNVAKLMLELLKNLEGDDGLLVTQLVQALIRAKLLLLESSIFENEPDFDALVKTPAVMTGEPHATFPRVVEVLWMAVTDPSTVKKHGWCTINKMISFIQANRPSDIAKHMRAAEQIVSRARFIMEEFIQHVTPLNMEKPRSVNMEKPQSSTAAEKPITLTAQPSPFGDARMYLTKKRPVRTNSEMYQDLEMNLPLTSNAPATASSTEVEPQDLEALLPSDEIRVKAVETVPLADEMRGEVVNIDDAYPEDTHTQMLVSASSVHRLLYGLCLNFCLIVLFA